MGAETDMFRAGPPWLRLLHQEADGDLTPAEAALLAAVPDQTEVARQRDRLAAAAHALTVLPPLPRSVAAAVAQDIRLHAALRTPLPVAPTSVAAAVAAEVKLDCTLALTAPPALPRSVAAQVSQLVRVSHALQTGPALPHSVAPQVAAEIATAARLQAAAPVLPRSVAAQVSQRLAEEQVLTRTGSAPLPVPSAAAALIGTQRNPAPLILVGSLLTALTVLAVSSAWPNLTAGALVLQTLLAQVSPLAGVGLGLALLTSLLVAWRPVPAAQRYGGLAFALSAVLTLPALYAVTQSGTIRFGEDVVVSGPVRGNVIAVGGNVELQPSAQVSGEVVTLLGDVRRAAGARVQGRVNALLGHAPGDREALETPVPPGLGAVTAAAFRPVLGWLGGAAWPQVFVTLTGGALLLLFVSGLAPLLARRQRHAPVRTLALGVLALSALLGPAAGLALVGLLGPAMIALALSALLTAVGLSVSAYDAGRALAVRARLPLPDVVGAMLGLSAVAASISLPPLAFAAALVGGCWGAGTLLLTRTASDTEAPAPLPTAA
ncbi:polymer-forming cytoskeletal protein [Deinococcus arboris]|nr:polymer-forming cytoskeletal protein [Deinococcus arboris]